MKISEKECLRCGHKWWPRVTTNPVQCPCCKSKYWHVVREENKAGLAKVVIEDSSE